MFRRQKEPRSWRKLLATNIWYFPENNTNLTETMNTTNQQLKLYLGGKTYRLYVISYNSLGESPVATLRIPAIDEKCKYNINFLLRCLTPSKCPRSTPCPLRGCCFSRVKMILKWGLFRLWGSDHNLWVIHEPLEIKFLWNKACVENQRLHESYDTKSWA